MKRWWSYSILPAMALGLGLPVQAPASTHCTVSIIMTTLGTDGTTVTQSMAVPPGATLQLQNNDGVQPTVGVPGGADTSDPSMSPSGSGSSSGSSTSPTPQIPTGGESNPTPDGTVPVPTDGTVPIPTDGSIPVPTSDGAVDEPLPPTPPVLEPGPPSDVPVELDTDPPVDDTAVPVPTGDVVSETPEPGTLTLLGLAAIGGLGYARKKRKVA